MKPSLLLLVSLVTLVVIIAPNAASAQEHVGRGNNIIGLRLLGGEAFAEERAEAVGGVGVTAERAFFHHRLELELVGAWMRHAGHNGVEGEIAFKFPVELSEVFDIYAGAGGVVENSDHKTEGGFVLDVGGRAWASEHWGLGLEFDFVTLLGEHTSRALEGVLDLMYRF